MVFHFHYIYVFWTLVSGLFALILCGKCPSPEISHPCICESRTKSIRCEGSHPIDLKSVFKNISQSLTESDKNFQFFILSNTGIKHLEDNTFDGITFRSISIFDVQSLESIDSNVFNGTTETIKTFEMIGKNSIKNMSEIFPVLNSIRNVISIVLNVFNLESLPPYGFHSLNQLQELMISNQQLNHLSDNCLHFDLESDESLIIDLSDNDLTDQSFDKNILLGVKRPLELDLRGNRLTVLNKQIFQSFLRRDERNSINLSANPINCSDCSNQWLFEERNKLEDQVLEARCQQFVSIFELDASDFQHCS